MNANEELLKLYNANVNLILIERLHSKIDYVLDLLNQSNTIDQTKFVNKLNDLFNTLFEPIAKEGYLLFEKDRILKSSFINHGQELNDFNSYLFLNLELNNVVNIIDEKFYSGILSYLIRFYKSCFNKINSSLISMNNTLLSIIHDNGVKVRYKVEEWKASIVSREIIDKREKLKDSVVAKLPFGHFTYCCKVDNIPSILKKGILSHNEVNRLGIKYSDISNQSVNSLRSKPNRYLNNKPAHDFVNLHINPQNNIIYYFVENAGGKKNLVCLKINPHVLIQRGGYFSEGNVARDVQNQHLSKISNDFEKFEFIDWKTLHEPNPRSKSKNPIYEIRKAEILIENSIGLEYVDKIIIYNSDVALNIMNCFPNHLGIELIIDPDFFDKIV